MKQREVSRLEVYETLENPTRTGLRTQPGRKRVRRERTERTSIDVIYEEFPQTIRIVTVMVLRHKGTRTKAQNRRKRRR